MAKEHDRQQQEETGPVSRRGFIRTAGVVTAGAAATGLGVGAAVAQAPPGRMPLATPVEKLGFTANELGVLTPNARKLTKSDLMALSQWERTRAGSPPLHVTIADINSIEAAAQSMQERMHKPGAAQAQGDVTACCCCCPCRSCASSVTQPLRPSQQL